MKYTYQKMTIERVKEISKWRYDGYMKEIYMKPYFDNHEKDPHNLKGPGNCDGFTVHNENDVIGLFEYYNTHKDIEIGLALNPKYVGKGMSSDFILDGIDFLIKNYKYNRDFIKLSVEIKNISAYKAYLKIGFKEVDRNDEEIFMRYYL